MAEFKRRVAMMRAYTDFRGLKDVKVDNRHWVDTSYYNILIGDAISAVLK